MPPDKLGAGPAQRRCSSHRITEISLLGGEDRVVEFEAELSSPEGEAALPRRRPLAWASTLGRRRRGALLLVVGIVAGLGAAGWLYGLAADGARSSGAVVTPQSPV